jgi:hypothetical protein
VPCSGELLDPGNQSRICADCTTGQPLACRVATTLGAGFCKSAGEISMGLSLDEGDCPQRDEWSGSFTFLG